jgi:2-methylisocitrate lyase-like PEP mutase family enzyme
VTTQTEKGAAFRALHARERAFIIPNPWDVGTTRLLTGMGFEALATTSAGYAFSVGRRDGAIARDEMLAHVSAIVAATDLPVSADLENGYGDAPEIVADTLARAARTGLAGGSIEDVPAHAAGAVYDIGLAADRIRAAAEVVRALPFSFTLTARAENFLVGRPDLADTITRLQAYQEAGADVLYAPGLTTKADIERVVRAVDRPLNVVMGLQTPKGVPLSLAELSALGVKRVSVGSALTRAAYGAMLRGAKEMHDRGTFTFADEAVSFRDITAMFPKSSVSMI